MSNRKRSEYLYVRREYLGDLAAFFRDPKTRAILAGFAGDPRLPLRYKDIRELVREEVPDPNPRPGAPDKKKYKEWNHNCCSAFVQNLVRWQVLRREGEGKRGIYYLNEEWWGEAKRAKTILDLEENSPPAIFTKYVKESGGPEALGRDEELPKDHKSSRGAGKDARRIALITRFEEADKAPYIPGGSTVSEGSATMYGMDIQLLDPQTRGRVKEALRCFDDLHRSLSHAWYAYTGKKYAKEFHAEVEKQLGKWQAPAVSPEWIAHSVLLRHFLFCWKEMEIAQAVHHHILGVESPDLPSLKTPSELERKGKSQAERCLECLPANISAAKKEAIMMGAGVYQLLDGWVPRSNVETYSDVKAPPKPPESQVVEERWVEVQVPKTAPQSAPRCTTEEGTPRCFVDVPWTKCHLSRPRCSTEGTRYRLTDDPQLVKGVEALMNDLDVFLAVAEETIEKVKGTVPPITTVLSSRLPPIEKT